MRWMLSFATGVLGPAASTVAQEDQWSNLPVGGGGYVTGLAIHPRQAGLLYIRTDVGGAYRWDPANARWIPILTGSDRARRT